jgi:hypothetical protein
VENEFCNKIGHYRTHALQQKYLTQSSRWGR